MRVTAPKAGLLAVLLTLHSFASAAPSSGLAPITLVPLAESSDARYARALFPADADPADSAAYDQPASADVQEMQQLLIGRIGDLADSYRHNRDSILAQLRVEGIALPAASDLPGPVGIEILDGNAAVAAAGSDGKIRISATTLRGFLIGAVRSSASENASESAMFRLMLGWRQKPDGSDVEWAGRVATLLDLVDAVPGMTISPANQQEAMAAAFKENEDQTAGPGFFESVASRVLEQHQPMSPVEAYRINMAMLFFGTYLHGAEERFLLAHELGHVVLRHRIDSDCARSARQEADADAFAIALLSYDFSSGVVDVLLFGQDSAVTSEYFAGNTTGTAADPDLRRGKYGYVQAFRYGMATAGMRGNPEAICPFVPAEMRLARADATQVSIASRRFEAYAAYNRYSVQKPGMAALHQSDELMDAKERAELLDTARSKCNGAAARLVRYKGQPLLNQKAHVYMVKCAWPAPGEVDVPAIARIMMGPQLYEMLTLPYGDGGAAEIEVR